ncbi:MAG: amidohydrolase [Proteobacteria bacterium]|nr:amidohydrolase [Pseudomonadota bacterium]MBU4389052.1 amidohydrolase [Pseudomonadota bacterium]MBU4420622.1 amidohydrolase [Pseudomonadota bacterium]MCG2831489.1 amidohydrolase [Desulfobacteraceae bacterium]
MSFDIIIHNGIIVTGNPDFDIIEDGIVCIKNGRLERIEPRTAGSLIPEANEIIDAKGGIIMPGFVNAHTHLPMSIFKGLADDLSLMPWLTEHIFPAESKYINPASARLGSFLSCAEMILAGITTCCDGYFFEDEVAEAVLDSGMRAILGQGVIDFPAPGAPEPSDNVNNAIRFTDKWYNKSQMITPSIFCHSPYTCSEGTLKKAKAATLSKNLLFQIHVAETKDERDRMLSEKNFSPIKYLDKIGILDNNTLLVHSIWVDNDDIDIIANRGAKISVCTESEMRLASGIAPVIKFLEAGIKVGLGTDGSASNNDLDLFKEMDSTAKLHKVNMLDPAVMDAKTVFKLATIGGAGALGLDNEIGSLETGKQADLIIIDVNKPHLVPMYNPVSHIVYAARGSDVQDVIVAGKVIVRDRKILTFDLEDVLERASLIGETIKGYKEEMIS